MVSEAPAFEEWPKIPRLSRDIVITEKIDGTNASILISDTGEPFSLGSGREVPFLCGSRTRWVYPENDNAGFARWAFENVEELLKLGPGHHFGEWWGKGIQRGYNISPKRFSLFNVDRWENLAAVTNVVSTVPLLYRGPFSDEAVAHTLAKLASGGSVAAPGFNDPEGIVIWHTAARVMFKKTIKNDEKPKGSKE